MRETRQKAPAQQVIAQLEDQLEMLAQVGNAFDSTLNTIQLERPVVSNLVQAARSLREARTFTEATLTALEATATEEGLL